MLENTKNEVSRKLLKYLNFWGGRLPRFSKARRSWPPRPPSATPLLAPLPLDLTLQRPQKKTACRSNAWFKGSGADPGGSHGSWPLPWGLGHHRPARSTTGLSGPPQAYTEQHRLSRDTSQGHHLSSRGTTGLPEVSQGCQGHHSPFQGHQCTTGLSEAPPAYQGHHRLSRGTTELPRDTR